MEEVGCGGPVIIVGVGFQGVEGLEDRLES